MSSDWWRKAIIYQIYPRSFQDSDGDGVGDLKGIDERLPYLVELGVDAIWLSPIFLSPMADFGYDIADYTAVDPLFGTLADFDALLQSAHGLGLKVLLDLVPNHTSDRHAWFKESRSSRNNPKRDWYIWRDPAPDGGPPNNWLSEFGGSAWELDRTTGQYYYHAFLSAQPDLNWRNFEVRNAMFDVMRFWFKRGVDGFRIDVLWHLIKDDQFRDNPPNPGFRAGDPPHNAFLPIYNADRPEVHTIASELRKVADEFGDRLLIGEIYLPLEKLMSYYGKDLEGVQLPFNFGLLSAPWNAPALKKLIDDYDAAIPPGAWPNWVLSNHDRPRIATRVGPDQARIAAMLLLTLRGTPTIYYGDELGMEQVAIAPDQVRDPFEKNVPGLGLGRDGCRTPMQWDGSAHAGFSARTPWLPLAPNFETTNVEEEQHDADSMLQLYRALLALRRNHEGLALGDYRPLAAKGELLLFVRHHEEDRLMVALNLGGEPVAVDLPTGHLDGRVLLSTLMDRTEEKLAGHVDLRPHEGLVIALHP